MQAVEAVVLGFPGFQRLESGLLTQLAAMSRIVEVARDVVLCRQGTHPQSLHYLLEGQVSLTQRASDGSITVIDVVEPVRSIALAGAITDAPQPLTAETLRPSRLLEMPVTGVRSLVATRPSLAVAILEALSLDFEAATEQVLDLKLRTSTQRLGYYLLGLVRDPTATLAEIELPVQKRLLAARLGCRFEHLSRAFALLRDLGVETHGSRVVLRDIPRLRAFALPVAPAAAQAFSKAFEL